MQSARTLNAEGNYLVLFETFSVSDLATVTPAEYTALAAKVAANPGLQPLYAPGVVQAMRNQLSGQVSGCGTFVAVYAP